MSIGQALSSGGAGGTGSECGGPGTFYLQQLAGCQNGAHYRQNRTLIINNNGCLPRDKDKNLTTAYTDISLGTTTAWIIPSQLPSFAKWPSNTVQSASSIHLEEIHIRGGGHVGFSNTGCSTCGIDIRIGSILGDRTGRFHLGFNQSLLISNGRLPADMAVYRGGELTLQGELRAAGVTVTMEGVLKDVENMTVVDGGMYFYHFFS